MSFNELNSVEHYIINKISGINLNTFGQVSEPQSSYGAGWQYIAPGDLQRSVNEVLLENELKAALVRLNPEITSQPELADEVIYKLRAVLIAVNQVGLVKANEEFLSGCVEIKPCPLERITVMYPLG